ncbi:MAG: hypothetical protein IT335_12785 [Thermomicrobiales bacterium]|nr:hypothetical protein [Thermomicrobiales bacterium]
MNSVGMVAVRDSSALLAIALPIPLPHPKTMEEGAAGMAAPVAVAGRMAAGQEREGPAAVPAPRPEGLPSRPCRRLARARRLRAGFPRR